MSCTVFNGNVVSQHLTIIIILSTLFLTKSTLFRSFLNYKYYEPIDTKLTKEYILTSLHTLVNCLAHTSVFSHSGLSHLPFDHQHYLSKGTIGIILTHRSLTGLFSYVKRMILTPMPCDINSSIVKTSFISFYYFI